jgi:hypothetical protein
LEKRTPTRGIILVGEKNTNKEYIGEMNINIQKLVQCFIGLLVKRTPTRRKLIILVLNRTKPRANIELKLSSYMEAIRYYSESTSSI